MNHEAERERALKELLARLAVERGIPNVAAADVDAYAAGATLAVLYTAAKSPESWDVAVVLPEVLQACPGVRAVALDPAESATAAQRWGVDKFPSVVVLRDGRYTGVIEGMQDWEPFCQALARLSQAEPRRAPSLRIPIVTESAARSV